MSGQGIDFYLSWRFRGIGGHACAPAGRGTTKATWTCPECSARWRAVEEKKFGTVFRTWQRAEAS